MKINWKYIILIFSTTVLLDLISTHFIANVLSKQGLSIAEIASEERNPIVSSFWTLTNNIVLGEVLDFLVKVLPTIMLLNSLLRWNKITFKHHGLIFFSALATAWYFFFFGAIHNTVYLITNNHLSTTLNIVGLAIFATLCFVAAATLEERGNPTIILTK